MNEEEEQQVREFAYFLAREYPELFKDPDKEQEYEQDIPQNSEIQTSQEES